MNILVTGASGFIGKNLVKALALNGHQVFEFSSSDGDIAEYDFIKRYAVHGIDFVYHLAGKTFVPHSWNDPSLFLQVNTQGTLNILDFCRKRSLPLLFVSAYVYGNTVKMPVSELCIPDPNNPYALSKFFAEKLCSFYSQYHNMDINIFRPFNVYGVGQDNRFLVPEIFSQVIQGKSIEVNTLTPKRDYIYIDDLIRALLLGMSHLDGLGVYNIGSGSSVSVSEAIDIIQNKMGTNLEVQSKNLERANEITDVIADIQNARDHLDWQPEISFEEGIKKIAHSFRSR